MYVFKSVKYFSVEKGPAGDQNISLLWIQIQGAHLRSQTLTLPLSPTSDLMWLGLSDARSPTIMDSDDVIRIYDKRSCQWRVLCDANTQVLQITIFSAVGVT